MKVSKSALVGLDSLAKHLEDNASSEGRSFVVPDSLLDVQRIRENVGMTQHQFAVSFGFPLKTLQNWEQGIRRPEGPARAYLRVIQKNPEAVLAALRG